MTEIIPLNSYYLLSDQWLTVLTNIWKHFLLLQVEDESDDGSDEDNNFVDMPSTSADDQPGPSGVGKDGGEAPWVLFPTFWKVCQITWMYKKLDFLNELEINDF